MSATVKIKAVTSARKCPKQLLIVPGISVGPLHLGMSTTEAGEAAKIYKCWHATLPTGDTAQYCVYKTKGHGSTGYPRRRSECISSTAG